MKLVRLSSWGMCAVVLALLATGSIRPIASQLPAAPSEGRTISSTQPANSDEWTRIGEWMRANNCAHRFDFIDHMPEGPRKGRAKQLITERYRMIQRVVDPDLHKALVAEVQAQDQIFALQIEYRRSRKHERPMSEMQAAVEKLIDAQVAEHKARAARLRTEADHLLTQADQLVTQKNNAQYIAQRAKTNFETAESPRQFRSSGERGLEENNDENSNADVVH